MNYTTNPPSNEVQVLYYSLNCKFCCALLDELKRKPEAAAQLQSVDCTRMDSSNGVKYFVVRDDGSRLELPFTVNGLPAIQFVPSPNVPYRRPVIGITAVAAHLGLRDAMAAGAAGGPVVGALPAAAAVVVAAAAPVPASAASLGGPASFVPSAPTDSVARP
jgi:hypothetical protein